MTDLYGSSKLGDKELQEFLLIEKQKAQFNAQVWDIDSEYVYHDFSVIALVH